MLTFFTGNLENIPRELPFAKITSNRAKNTLSQMRIKLDAKNAFSFQTLTNHLLAKNNGNKKFEIKMLRTAF